ncbi:MAG TPA: transposase [Thiotrichales bacterium]|nr:transposase [Thiotrichales bacterium]
MTRPRSELVSLEETPFYHCISRCVRQAHLCGQHEGKDYQHRKEWILHRLRFATASFAINVAAYAILSNHYHLVLRVDEQRARSWSPEEVARRWLTIYPGDPLGQRFLQNEDLSEEEKKILDDLIERWRHRLYDLSWFMRTINEYVARLANIEEGKKGRFWEGRFRSNALLDERAVLACMTYVDLNPVRAGVSTTPEDSDFTSIQERIRAYSTEEKGSTSAPNPPFREEPRYLLCLEGSFPTIDLKDYLDLVDWTGRSWKGGAASIPEHLPPILKRLGLESTEWLEHTDRFDRSGFWAFGAFIALKKFANRLGQAWIRGMGDPAVRLLPPSGTPFPC